MRVLVLGASGMAGHMIYHYLTSVGHDVYGLTRKKVEIDKNIICDMCDIERIKEIINNGNYDYLINCIGILNKSAEDNKDNAVFLNSFMPHYLCSLIKNTQTRLIHMSTDCVFSGLRGNYTESDIPDGQTFYDRSKALGEILDDSNLTFRNSIIGPDMNKSGIGLFNWFMQQSNQVNGFTKTIWSGVTTLTLAKAMDFAMKKNLTGLYHLTNNQPIDKYALISLINEIFDRKLLISKTDGVKLDKSLLSTRIDFDFIVPSYRTMLQEMKDWIVSHKEMYLHYQF